MLLDMQLTAEANRVYLVKKGVFQQRASRQKRTHKNMKISKVVHLPIMHDSNVRIPNDCLQDVWEVCSCLCGSLAS